MAGILGQESLQQLVVGSLSQLESKCKRYGLGGLPGITQGAIGVGGPISDDTIYGSDASGNPLGGSQVALNNASQGVARSINDPTVSLTIRNTGNILPFQHDTATDRGSIIDSFLGQSSYDFEASGNAVSVPLQETSYFTNLTGCCVPGIVPCYGATGVSSSASFTYTSNNGSDTTTDFGGHYSAIVGVDLGGPGSEFQIAPNGGGDKNTKGAGNTSTAVDHAQPFATLYCKRVVTKNTITDTVSASSISTANHITQDMNVHNEWTIHSTLPGVLPDHTWTWSVNNTTGDLEVNYNLVS
tara:strand:+ start:470 stop:1366 length:897 start_codon:yes stop_codon:yes gene_type:complete